MIRLGDHPEMGPRRDHLAPGYRSIRVERHVLYYRIEDNEIEIIRILDERMGAARHLAS